MYQDYFGLNSKPFGIVPDTRFLYLSDKHREAIAHLVYALNEKNGFVQLTGEVGVGKTMACRYILANIPEDIDVALILNPRIGEIGLLRTLCQELDIPYGGEQKTNELTQLINNKLLDTHARGRHTILIIDEAQNLPKRTLEQLRLLTNLETDTQKLLRIIMIGQPELGHLLSAHDMRQVAQRITSRYHLSTLGLDETDQYIQHRLAVAGCHRRLFTKAATRKIHRLTEGTPRLINLLCEHALIGAYSRNMREITPKIVRQASKEALPYVRVNSPARKSSWLPALLLFLLVLIVIALYKPELRANLSSYWLQTPITEQVANEPKPLPAITPAVKPEPAAPATDIRAELETPVAAERTEIEETQPSPATTHSTLTPEKLEAMKNEADVDFRLGIPADVTEQVESRQE